MKFNDLIGQDELKAALTGALLTNSVSHATLITGPAGSGKKSWGMALAGALLCRQEIEGCNSCSSCRNFASGVHPAFERLTVEGKQHKIEQIRQLRPFFQRQGITRVCLIEDAQKLSAPAASALLVTLEEPPADLYFILLAEQADQLFSTIVSRCRRYNLKPLSAARISAVLSEKHDLSEQARTVITALSKGLPGRALALAADPLFEERLLEAQQWAESLAGGDRTFVSRIADLEQFAARNDLAELLGLICLYFREMLIKTAGGETAFQFAPDQLIPAAKGRECLENIEEAILLIDGALKDLATTNINRRLLIETTIALIQRRLSRCRW